jgi:hypothetical protein
MDHLKAGHWRSVADYLREEVPWEMERLESVTQLVNSWPDWAYASPDSHQISYSSLLRDTYGPLLRVSYEEAQRRESPVDRLRARQKSSGLSRLWRGICPRDRA